MSLHLSLNHRVRLADLLHGDMNMASAIPMIAHCLFHQTPVLDRAYCPDCQEGLAVIQGSWYCPRCLVRRDVDRCPICHGQSWN